MDDNFRSDIGYGPGATEAFPAESGPSRVDPWAGVVPGLASLGIAMTFIIGAPGTMHVIWELYFHRFHGFSPVQVALVAICGFLGFLMIGTALVFGFVFGVGAILAARRHNRSAALGVAGALLNGFAVLLWIFIAILWVFAVASSS